MPIKVWTEQYDEITHLCEPLWWWAPTTRLPTRNAVFAFFWFLKYFLNFPILLYSTLQLSLRFHVIKSLYYSWYIFYFLFYFCNKFLCSTYRKRNISLPWSDRYCPFQYFQAKMPLIYRYRLMSIASSHERRCLQEQYQSCIFCLYVLCAWRYAN